MTAMVDVCEGAPKIQGPEARFNNESVLYSQRQNGLLERDKYKQIAEQ